MKKLFSRVTLFVFLCALFILLPLSDPAPDPLAGNSSSTGSLSAVNPPVPAACNTDKTANLGAAAGQPFMQLPLLFIKNCGQADSSVSYYVKAGGQTVYFTGQGLIFELVRSTEEAGIAQEKMFLGLDFIGAGDPVIEGVSPMPGKANYLKGNDPDAWHTDIPLYREIVYRGIYNGIDLRFYDDGEGLRYDFIVNPGADLADIRLAYEGAEELAFDRGELIAGTALGEVRQTTPFIYQEHEGERMEVAGGFTLHDGGSFGFKVASYDADLPLIIDPSISYSSYFGGSGDDQINSVVLDGNYAYVCGLTASSEASFPLKPDPGAFQTTFNGGSNDAFVAKFDISTTGAASLIYSTYIGGDAVDVAEDIAVLSNEAYITGYTTSSDFPVANTTFGDSPYGNKDMFVTRLNNTGTGVLCSRYVGGTADDFASGIYIESGEEVWIAATVGSGGIACNLAYQDAYQGGFSDAFIAQLDMTDGSVGIASYFGGTGMDQGTDVTLSDSANPVLLGHTDAFEGFPDRTAGAYQTACAGGMDVFIVRFNGFPSGGLLYHTLLGGGNGDVAVCIESLPTSRQVYVGGQTWSTSGFPTTPGAYQSSTDSAAPAFITLLDMVGGGASDLKYSSYFCGYNSSNIRGIALEVADGYDHAWVTGETNSGLPIKNAFQSSFGGGSEDAFVAKFDPNESGDDSLVSSSFLGGNGNDYGYGIAINGDGRICVAGRTGSGDFDTTGGYQTTKDTGTDGFLTTLIYPVTVSTDAASSVEETTATLNGKIELLGGAACDQRGFVWGTASRNDPGDTAPGSSSYGSNWTEGGSFSVETFSRGVSSLNRGTRYYARACAHNADGWSYGEEVEFLTKPNPPASFTATAASSTQINVSWSKGSGADRTMVRRATGSYPGDRSSGTQVYFNTGTSFNDTGLNKGTQYYYRAWSEVTDDGDTQWSDTAADATDTTPFDPPTVTTSAAGSVEETTATLNGAISDTGGENCTSCGFVWDTTSNADPGNTAPGSSDYGSNWTEAGSFGAVAFNHGITALSKGSKYYVRACAQNSEGWSYGDEVEFLTKPDAPSGFSATAISSTQIDLDWTKGDGANRTMVRRKTGGYPTDRTDGTQVYFDTGSSCSDTGLTRYTTYYYRAWSEVTEGSDTQWSDANADDNARTLAELPTAVTDNVTAVEETTATLNGTISDTGGVNCDSRGFVWDTTSHADPGDTAPAASGYASNWTEAGSFGAVAFNHGITALSKGTKYYLRACAQNSEGWSYGDEVEFLTRPDEPSAFTATATGSTQIDLAWTKGEGANRTMVRRAVGGYPADRSDGVEVYFDTGSSYSDTGLTRNTTYYYRAWSEVTGSQQWSDSYVEDSEQTPAELPSVTTDAAGSVEETTATLNGSIADTGGVDCDGRGFVWDTASRADPGDTAPGASAYGSSWTEAGAFDTGAFDHGIAGLSKGTKYYARACAQNSQGWSYGDEVELLAKPDTPQGLTATAASSTQIDLAWARGEGAARTMVRRATGGYPADHTAGTQVYFGAGTSVSDTGLSPNTTYYYRAWSEVTGSQQWSDDFAQASPSTPTQTTAGNNNQATNSGFAAPGAPGGHSVLTPAKVLVPQVNVRSQRIQVGQAAVIYANVVNRGESSGTYKVELKVDDEVVETRQGTISGNMGVPLEFTVVKDTPGTYTVEIDGKRAFFTVIEQGNRSGSGTGLYIMGCTLCILGAIMAVMVILRRRSHWR